MMAFLKCIKICWNSVNAKEEGINFDRRVRADMREKLKQGLFQNINENSAWDWVGLLDKFHSILLVFGIPNFDDIISAKFF
jgi:hypothetical protein